MEASLQEKNGKYHVVIAYKDRLGKPKRKWVTTNIDAKPGNKKKAKERRDEILAEFESGERDIADKRIENHDIMFGNYLKHWLLSRKPELEENTYDSYEHVINLIARKFTHMKLKDLQPYHIQEYYNQMYAEGKKGNTALHHHVLIKQAIDKAYEDGLIKTNIMVKVARPKKQKFVAEFYNIKELQELYECSKGDPMELIIYLASFYGLRRSEVIGLKWSNIDFENKIIMLRHKVIEVKSEILGKDKMKNNSSLRALPLIPYIEELLLQEKKKQEKNKRTCKNYYNYKYSDYICVNSVGDLLTPGFVTQHFQVILKRNNLRHIRFHDLRHSCASVLLAHGISMKHIQEWLGHSTFQITADTYSHLDFSSKISSARTISENLTMPKIFTQQPKLLDYEALTEDELDRELERLQQEKMLRQRKKQDFEMWKKTGQASAWLVFYI